MSRVPAGFQLDEMLADKLLRTIELVESIRGPGVTRTPRTITIAWPPVQRLQQTMRDQELTFPIAITGHTPIGTGNRWSYAWKEVQPVAGGTYQDLAGGRTSTGTLGSAYNDMEAYNTASVIGGGDNPGDFPGGVALLPIGVGVVWAQIVTTCTNTQEVRFSMANNPGGVPTCTGS